MKNCKTNHAILFIPLCNTRELTTPKVTTKHEILRMQHTGMSMQNGNTKFDTGRNTSNTTKHEVGITTSRSRRREVLASPATQREQGNTPAGYTVTYAQVKVNGPALPAAILHFPLFFTASSHSFSLLFPLIFVPV